MEKMGVSRETIEKIRNAIKEYIQFVLDLWTMLLGKEESSSAAMGRMRERIEALKESFKALFVGIGNWIGDIIDALADGNAEKTIAETRQKVITLCEKFPIY